MIYCENFSSMKKTSIPVSAFLLVTIMVCGIFAQTMNKAPAPDSVLYELTPIVVTAMRIPQSQIDAPYALTPLDAVTIQQARRQLSLKESLGTVPGLFVLNANNFAQDLRLAIRGFGTRAAFGIRGIKILIDGIPETTPDGQTQLDNLDMGLIQKIEVIRGPVSALYGNAAGGVVSLSSEIGNLYPHAGIRMATGAFGYNQAQIQYGQQNLLLSLVHNRIDGFRKHSAMRNYLFNSLFKFGSDSTWKINARINVEYSPQAQDAGGLNRAQVDEDPTQANITNVYYNAGEEVLQGRLGILYISQPDSNNEFRLSGNCTRRIFDNRLTFTEGGIVHLDRYYTMLSAVYNRLEKRLRLPMQIQTGLDLAYQHDHRKRYDNMNDIQGDLRFDQIEKYMSLGIFLQNRIVLNSFLKMQFGLRFDQIRITADHQLERDSDYSGHRDYYGFNGMGGILFDISSGMKIYTNISSGFDTPALIELSTNPAGTGGLNPYLNAQRSLSIGAGLKGILSDRFQYELSLFTIDVRDELIPYELPETPGRTYYKNAGKSRHRGLEFGLNGIILRGLTFSLAYTAGSYRYTAYRTGESDFSGKRIPGLPEQYVFGEIYYVHPVGFFTRLELNATGKLYTDDANSATENAYFTAHIQAGYRFLIGRLKTEPFIGLNNMTNRQYSDNIRINAAGGRFYEPAPGFNLYGGVKIEWTL